MQSCKEATDSQAVAIQRGDVVDVKFAGNTFQYRGVVRASSKRHGIFVITKNSGHGYKPALSGTTISLVERTGKRRFDDIFEMSRQFS